MLIRTHVRIVHHVLVLMLGIVGGSTGLLIGRQGDVLLHVDTQIVGVIIGAVVGSVLLSSGRKMYFIQGAAAVLGVLVPVIRLVGIERTTLVVLVSMVCITVLWSVFSTTLFVRPQQPEQGNNVCVQD